MSSNFIQRSRHGTVFHFRRRVPKDLVGRIGRSHLVSSLHTEQLAEARKRGRALAAATDELFTELRNMPSDKKPRSLRTHYGLGIELDPATGFLTKIQITDANPGDASAISQNIAALMAGASTQNVPGKPTSDTTPTIAEAATALLAAPGRKPTTRKRYSNVFDHFGEFLGADRRLGSISQEDFARYADSVTANASWSDKTKRDYITTASQLFAFYEARNSAVPKISTKGLKPKRTTPAGQDRDAFTLDEYRLLFENAAAYRTRAPHKWWATVACAFLGCRIEELTQAHLGKDFVKDPSTGYWFMKIDESDERKAGIDTKSPKSVKTLSSWRKVPLHSALIDAGFIDYLEAERAAGASTPFGRRWKSLLDKETGGTKHSHQATKWGSTELAKLRLEGKLSRPGLTYFHSMRHAFTTLLSAADVGEERRAVLAGHSYGGVNAQIYNKGGGDLAIMGPLVERGLEGLAEVLRVVSFIDS
jgi:integrase